MKIRLVVAVFLLCITTSGQSHQTFLDFFPSSNRFSAYGRWVASDPNEKSSIPSETQIDCDRQSKTCVEATAEYYAGHPHVSIAYYEIVKWDENGFIAKSSNPICMTLTVVVSFSDKSITSTHSPKKLDREKAEACKTLGLAATFNEVFIVKNSDKWNADPYGESSEKY